MKYVSIFFLIWRFRSSVKPIETHFGYPDANEDTTNKALSLGRKGSQCVLRNSRGKILLVSGRKSERIGNSRNIFRLICIFVYVSALLYN